MRCSCTPSSFLGALLVAIWRCLPHVSSIAIDNGIIGLPDVVCLADRIRLLVNTRRPFYGHVYVKSFYRHPECHRTFADSSITQQELVFDVFLNGPCNVNRQRTTHPPGIAQSVTVVVQFHQHFVTKVDGAFRLQCVYQETAKPVTQRIDVSMLPTTELAGAMTMPACRYQVLAGTINGPPVRSARIGDKLIHKWTCEQGAGAHNMLIHSCRVRDSTGLHDFPLLDNNGCTIDPVALGNLQYSPNLMTAWAETHAFKFADQVAVHFQCQITLCTTIEDQCRGITPPRCHNSRPNYDDPNQRRPAPSGHLHNPSSHSLPAEFQDRRSYHAHKANSAAALAVKAADKVELVRKRLKAGIDSSGLIPWRARKRDHPMVLLDRTNSTNVNDKTERDLAGHFVTSAINTLTVDAEDVLVFTAEDEQGHVSNDALKRVVASRDSSPPFGGVRAVNDLGLPPELCLSYGATVKLAVLLPVLFVAMLSLLAVFQRRYYVAKVRRLSKEVNGDYE